MGLRKFKTGVVLSDRMAKTVSVLVERVAMDPRYKKYIRRRKKFLAHDEQNACHVGDRVEIEECRPLSRRKHWKVVRVTEKTA